MSSTNLKFTREGVLPAADFSLTLGQIEASLLVKGPHMARAHRAWDVAWRRRLVQNLGILVGQLWRVGIETIYIDGSFVEDKDHPNDIDGYFECDAKYFASGQLERDLNLLDPHKCWTWDKSSRRPYRGSPKLQLPMWHAYRVEFYPHYAGVLAGEDAFGNELEFPAFFRQCRSTGRAKGIVRVVRG